MEIDIKSHKRRKHSSLLKKLTLLLICFCLIVFILFNYLCNDNRCFLANRYFLHNKFYRFNSSTNYLDDQSIDAAEQFSRISQLEKVKKSDQLIGSRRKSRLIDLSEQPTEYNARIKYLKLINDSSTNRTHLHLNQVTYNQIHSGDNSFKFNMYDDDVIVFLHIQKTGGTSFGKRLVHDLLLDKPCECFEGRKHCSCIRPLDEQSNKMISRLHRTNQTKSTLSSVRSKYWLFSRYSTGWICGLHADWTQLTFCADDGLNRVEKVKLKRRYFFITLLRDPVLRFLSEFNHVRKGATWSKSRYACSTEFAQDSRNENSDELMKSSINSQSNLQIDRTGNSTMKSVKKCYSGDDWSGVDLNDYMNCDTNPAINRMTRMLADLTKVGCLNNETNYDRLLLESAKFNLERLAYFGVLEYQVISQFVLESTLDFEFKHSFIQLNRTHSTQIKINLETVELIKKLNYLDMKLYEFGKQILFDRFEKLKISKSFDQFKQSKLSSLDDLETNLNRFPELKLLQKLSKLDTNSPDTSGYSIEH